MEMEKPLIKQKRNVKSWNRFITRWLAVKPELMGLKHQFQFEDNQVEISLPEVSHVKSHHDDSAMATVGSRWANSNEPIEYKICQVNVRSNIGCTLDVDPETFNRNPVAYELYTDAEREVFETQCNAHEIYAKRALEHWFLILRWKLDDYRVGRVDVVDNDSGWSTYLEDIEKSKTVWIKRVCITVQGYTVITLNEWNNIQDCLISFATSPIYISLKHDAEYSMIHGDYVRSIVELAMACEVFMRFMVLNKLPKHLNSNLVEAIEELNINQYVTKHFRALVPKDNLKEYGKMSKELSSLFSKRNKIVHMGKNDGADQNNCERFLKLANIFFKYSKFI